MSVLDEKCELASTKSQRTSVEIKMFRSGREYRVQTWFSIYKISVESRENWENGARRTWQMLMLGKTCFIAIINQKKQKLT